MEIKLFLKKYTRCWILDAGCLILDARYWILDDRRQRAGSSGVLLYVAGKKWVFIRHEKAQKITKNGQRSTKK